MNKDSEMKFALHAVVPFRYFLVMSLLVTVACGSTTTIPATEISSPSNEIEAFTSGMQKHEGFFNFYYDAAIGRVFLEVDKVDQEFLYVNALAAGVGSNDIGLDRGQLGNERVVKFEHHGNKLLLIQPNQDYRAVSDNQEEVQSVAEAFASSVIGGWEISTRSESAFLGIIRGLQRSW